MSDIHMGRPVATGAPTLGEAATYRAVFSAIFLYSFATSLARRLVGKGSANAIWHSAKQAAHAGAGYAVKY